MASRRRPSVTAYVTNEVKEHVKIMAANEGRNESGLINRLIQLAWNEYEVKTQLKERKRDALFQEIIGEE